MRSNHNWICRQLTVALGVAVLAGIPMAARAADILVADRLKHNVFRYSESGQLLNTVLTDNSLINQAVGLALSPDQTQLYVSSALDNHVVKYDYDVASGVATNGAIFAQAGLEFPNSILFSEDESKIYISNYGAPSVGQFNLDGTPAGPLLTGLLGVQTEPFPSSIPAFSGLAFAPSGELLVGGWAGFPDASYGAIGKSDQDITAFSDFTGPVTEISGASGLLVRGEYLYVTGMLASNIRRINLDDGSLDPDFEVAGLAFPQGLLAMPDGESMIVGILGDQDGLGRIDRYDFDGNFLGAFAITTPNGFKEATAFILVADRGLPGDFNEDGSVDAADYTVWRDHFGTPFDLGGNGDETGGSENVVDGADYALWKGNFGNGTPPTAVGRGVPEPGSCVLMMVASGCVVSIRRRRLAGRVKLQKI